MPCGTAVCPRGGFWVGTQCRRGVFSPGKKKKKRGWREKIADVKEKKKKKTLVVFCRSGEKPISTEKRKGKMQYNPLCPGMG